MKETLKDFIDALVTVIGCVILFGIGLTLFLGFLKLGIWIWGI